MVNGRALSFYSTGCVIRACQLNVDWTPCVVAALKPYAKGKGGRGVVQRALNTLENIENNSDAPGQAMAGNMPFEWDELALQRYFTLLGAGLFEWHERLGSKPAKRWKEKLLEGFAGKEAFLCQRRCSVWAGLDSTSMFLIGNYIRKLGPVQAMMTVVIVCVCYCNWRYAAALFGSEGAPYPLTALTMAKRHQDARSRSELRLSPVGGLTGSSRLSLGSLAKRLGLQQSSGQNSEHYHCFLSFLYAEHVSAEAEAAWDELSGIMLQDQSQRERNSLTLEVLQRRFLLHGLTREHVARLLGQLDRRLYDAAVSDFVGERAQMGLERLIGKSGQNPQVLLANLAHTAAVKFPSFIKRKLGPAAAQFLEKNMPPAASDKLLTLDHLQLHEHGACEFIKNEDSSKRHSKGLYVQTEGYAELASLAYGSS